jgi:hypothetical protein
MTRGPLRAIIEEGALALEHGWDPLVYLGLGHEDRLVARQILELVSDRKGERQQAFWKNVANAVQSGVARAFKSSS